MRLSWGVGRVVRVSANLRRDGGLVKVSRYIESQTQINHVYPSRKSIAALLPLQIRSSRLRSSAASLVPYESIMATDPLLPNPGDILSFQNRLTLTTCSSFTSSTVSLTSTSTPSRTHASSSAAEPATVLSTSDTLAFAFTRCPSSRYFR